jgi:hypothetical protein
MLVAVVAILAPKYLRKTTPSSVNNNKDKPAHIDEYAVSGTVLANSPGKTGFVIDALQSVRIPNSDKTQIVKVGKAIGFTAAEILRYSVSSKKYTKIRITDIPVGQDVVVYSTADPAANNSYNATKIVYTVK